MKRLLALLIAAGLVVSTAALVGCSDAPKDKDAKDKKTTVTAGKDKDKTTVTEKDKVTPPPAADKDKAPVADKKKDEK